MSVHLSVRAQRAATVRGFDTAKLRVYVNVRRITAQQQVGTKAQITVPDIRDAALRRLSNPPHVRSTSASGTTRMQLLVDNAGGELMTGGSPNGGSICPSRRMPSAYRQARSSSINRACVSQQSGPTTAVVNQASPSRAILKDCRDRNWP